MTRWLGLASQPFRGTLALRWGAGCLLHYLSAWPQSCAAGRASALGLPCDCQTTVRGRVLGRFATDRCREYNHGIVMPRCRMRTGHSSSVLVWWTDTVARSERASC